MAIIFDTAFGDFLAFILTLTICVYLYYQWAFQYWKRKGVPSLNLSIPFGNLANPIIQEKSFTDTATEQYQEAKSKGYKHLGLYIIVSPMYMPLDLECIRHIMVKGFDHFMDRGIYYNEKDDPLSAHIFNIEGAKWRNLRMKLTPTFTSGKMKMMFQTLVECSNQLRDHIENVSQNNQTVNIKKTSGCFTTDVIASCAFGIECNSFKNTNSEFIKYLQRFFVLSTPQILGLIFGFMFPNAARRLGIPFLSKDVSRFFMEVIKNTVEYREKNNFIRKDFMQLLLDLKNNALEKKDSHHHDGKNLTINELAAQAFLFLAAGFETSSTTMTFCLFELAINQDIQDKVRKEINLVMEKHNGEITYDGVMEMKYLGQVIDESLRKYPPFGTLNRVCASDYKLPGNDLVIEKGTTVVIPVLGLQRDPDYFPDPERFDPDRFSDENKHKIQHFSYLPFGEGPRNCIGLRFGLMQAKVGLATLLRDHVFTLNSKTKIPLKMNPHSVVMSALGDIWLDVKKVDNKPAHI